MTDPNGTMAEEPVQNRITCDLCAGRHLGVNNPNMQVSAVADVALKGGQWGKVCLRHVQSAAVNPFSKYNTWFLPYPKHPTENQIKEYFKTLR